MGSTQIDRYIRPLTGLVGVLVLVAACSSAGGASSAPSSAPSTAAASPGASTAGGEVYEVTVATGSMGVYLAGEDGKTLYTFASDSANTSACLDTCAGKWPPFTIESDDTLKAGSGVTGPLATFARPDGSMQVAYNGIPLYYYGGDAKAGDTKGEGVGGKWYVASPTGVAGGSAAPSVSSGGY
jgi:predicted lipoprotein with Yx(FWY)xxD motif